MIKNIEEAKELCSKYGIKLSDHKVVIVTGNNSIYLTDSIDPADTSAKFYLKGAAESEKPTEEIKEVVSEIAEEKESEKPTKKGKK